MEEGTAAENANKKGDDDKSVALTSAFDSTAGSVLDGEEEDEVEEEEDEVETPSGCCLAWRILGLVGLIIFYAASIPIFCWVLTIYDPKKDPDGVVHGHMAVFCLAGAIALGSYHLALYLKMLDLVLRGHPFRSFHRVRHHALHETYHGLFMRKWKFPVFLAIIICKFCL